MENRFPPVGNVCRFNHNERLLLLATAACFLVATACFKEDRVTSGATDVRSSADGGADPDMDSGDAGADAISCTPPSAPPKVVFLNRGGGVYTPGIDNSPTNKTSLVNGSTTVTPWAIANAAWQTLLACVNQKFAPFNVTITDVDPGDTEHIEVVFAQASVSALSGASSVAPFTCNVVPNAIAFVSQAYAEANPIEGCAAVAASVGYSLGVEAVAVCPDAMSFAQTSCPSAGFTNVALSCGSNTPANCQCVSGATTQNSYARLLAITGPRCL